MKKLVFLTGTRADFGKIKSLLAALDTHPDFDLHLFVTGMHMMDEYGRTEVEVKRAGYGHIHTFENHTSEASMELTLARTIEGFSTYVRSIQPDLIVVHGDRVEALAGAIVGSLNNILVGHIEGGELSGTIDDLIRHSVSKLSHVHFVANKEAKRRLVQMGESDHTVQVIGSPDIDVMRSGKLPELEEVKRYYDIAFADYAIGLYHPVTTEVDQIEEQVRVYTAALKDSKRNYVLIYPNNDMGSSSIIASLKAMSGSPRVRLLPSVRFEYFLTLLKHASFIIGNSSAGIREAPFYGVPTVNIGSRQENRSTDPSIINVDYDAAALATAIEEASSRKHDPSGNRFGEGDSTERFVRYLEEGSIWDIAHQKPFIDL